MLSVSDLDVSIGPVPVIRKASLDLAEGEMCGLIGRNGAGKTTLLRALMGAIPATGKVFESSKPIWTRTLAWSQ